MADQTRKPVLYLLPSLLGDTTPSDVLPELVISTIRRIKHFIVEDIRTSRRFIKAIDKSIDINGLQFYILNEHTSDEELPLMLEPLISGHDTGLLSEAGLPCVADPGAKLVGLAHQSGFQVKPLTGPSSIYLALMASGFNGQNFIFHGYLPVDKQQRVKKIKEIEADTHRLDRTQIFIEAPYRNNQLLQSIIQTCNNETMLCIASDLTTKNEIISIKPIKEWKASLPDFHKKPVVFLLYH
jgi:16S rRNA (cytidine1402-2'-O)-methyltransferase